MRCHMCSKPGNCWLWQREVLGCPKLMIFSSGSGGNNASVAAALCDRLSSWAGLSAAYTLLNVPALL